MAKPQTPGTLSSAIYARRINRRGYWTGRAWLSWLTFTHREYLSWLEFEEVNHGNPN